MLMAWRAGPRGRFALAYVTTLTMGVMPFFVTDRYRHHLAPGAALLAGLWLAEVLALWGRSSITRAARLGAGLVVGIGVVTLPVPGLDATRIAWDIAFNLGARWLERGRPDLALQYLEKAIRIDQSGDLAAPPTPTAQVTRAALYENDAIALRELNRLDAAVASYD